MGVSKYNADVIKYGDTLNVPPGGGGLATSVQTSNYTITEDEDVGVDSSGGTFTVTLKASPSTGDVAIIRDVGQNCGTTNVAVARNGSTINGAAADENLDVDNGMYMFVYNGTTWKFTPFSGPGLNEAEVDARVTAVAPTAYTTGHGASVTHTVGFTLADDSVAEYDFVVGVSAGSLLVGTTVSGTHGAFALRAQSSSAFVNSISSAGISTTTGILTGTTGADGALTISTHTNFKLYVENRLGFPVFVSLNIGRSRP